MRAAADLTAARLSAWCDLPGDRSAPALARRWVTAMLASWDLGLSSGERATIVGLTSELVTNAVQHAVPAPGSPAGVRVTVRAGRGVVWLAVCDPDPTPPAVREPDFLAESGRGLYLVQAQADRWGSVPHAGGKYVWFSLCCGAARPSPRPHRFRSVP
ncbi:ATP-binding protein [Sphaerisporangium rufum]|uniref:ATP-binding protein n=1 Tax=Sphaerisporangium rufum TaxID=1381558 RepID=A0A919V0U6_9ACTN|nr:ATP-binding protein [Sphaerisporangium rufum]GII77128.1 ATP-binding protein [Sphaerisporangium rufum]